MKGKWLVTEIEPLRVQRSVYHKLAVRRGDSSHSPATLLR